MIVWHVLLLLIGFQRNYSMPTASMQPTIAIGDVFAMSVVREYGFGVRLLSEAPGQGDAIIFYNTPTHEAYTKRVIGVTGDRVAMDSGRLYVNGRIVDRRFIEETDDIDSFDDRLPVSRYEETLPNGTVHLINEVSDDQPLDNFAETLIPPDRLFVMGDNRDRSADSRVTKQVGLVPIENGIAIQRANQPIFFWNRSS